MSNGNNASRYRARPRSCRKGGSYRNCCDRGVVLAYSRPAVRAHGLWSRVVAALTEEEWYEKEREREDKEWRRTQIAIYVFVFAVVVGLVLYWLFVS